MPDGRCTTGSSRRSTTTWTSPRRSPWCARRSVLPTSATMNGGGSSSMPTPSSGSTWIASGPRRPRQRPTGVGRRGMCPPTSPPSSATARRLESRETSRPPMRYAGRWPSSVGRSWTRPPGLTSGRWADEVQPAAEAVDDPVEVALRQAVALGVGKTRPTAMLEALRRQVDGDGPTSGPPLPFVAEDQAPPDVEVAVEPEPFVEGTALDRVGPPEGLGVSLDGIDVARGCRVEPAEVGRSDPPSPGDRDRVVVERADERRDDVAGREDARVHHDHDRSARAADPDVQRRGLAQPFARPDGLDRWTVGGLAGAEIEESRLLTGRRRVGDDDDVGPGRRLRAERVDGAAEVVGMVGRDEDDRREPGGRLL